MTAFEGGGGGDGTQDVPAGSGTRSRDEVIDLRPFIRRRELAKCEHLHVTIDDDYAELTCDDCERRLNPMKYLRRLADRWEYWERQNADLQAKFAEEHDRLTRSLRRLTDEVNALIETKNRLWNEQVNGKPLGTLVKRPRSRPVRK